MTVESAPAPRACRFSPSPRERSCRALSPSRAQRAHVSGCLHRCGPVIPTEVVLFVYPDPLKGFDIDLRANNFRVAWFGVLIALFSIVCYIVGETAVRIRKKDVQTAPFAVSQGQMVGHRLKKWTLTTCCIAACVLSGFGSVEALYETRGAMETPLAMIQAATVLGASVIPIVVVWARRGRAGVWLSLLWMLCLLSAFYMATATVFANWKLGVIQLVLWSVIVVLAGMSRRVSRTGS
jgi:hypothetical protein